MKSPVDITVPQEVIQKWQRIVNIMAEIMDVPAALIMKVELPYIKVFRSSKTRNNPYTVGAKEHLYGSGLYCEHVVKTKKKLSVPNALRDKHWDKNPDIKLGMISYLGFPLLWPDGEVFGTICALDSKENGHNKTYEELILQFKELIEAHLGLLHDRKHLDDLVGERTAELKKTNEQLLQAITERKQAQTQLIQLEKMNALDTLSAGIAHELNNPLMGMLNFVQYCIEKTSRDDRKYEVLKDTEDATQRCIDIVRNLLAFSRMGDKESYEKQSCGVLIDQVLKLISYRTEGVLIEHCISEDTPEILMKANGIRQVFLNLLTNALDAVENEEKKEIRIRERREGEYVRITIADTGCGIPPENTGKVLDPFFTTKGPKKGTGLGLSVSRTIVEGHGGMIRCKSEPGEGSEFTILLPIERGNRDE